MFAKHLFIALLLFSPALAQAPRKGIPPKTAAPAKKSTDEQNADKATAAFEAGQDAHQRGELDKAVALYEQAAKLDPALWQADYQLATLHFGAQRYAAARTTIVKVIEALTPAPELKPYLARAQTLRGEIALAENQPAEAESAFRKTLELNATNARALSGLAELALRNNQPAEAVKLAQNALSNGDNSAHTIGLLGEALLLTNKPQEAVAAFTQALQLEPQRAAFLLGRATAYALTNDEAKAIQDLTAALPLENNAATRLRLARLYANTKAYAEATTLYQQVLKDEPDNQEAQTALAVLMVESGQSAEAIAALENLLKTSPDRADVRAQLAALYLPTSPDKALIQYLAANKLNPAALSYPVGAASAYVKLKRFSEAIALLRRVLEQNPKGDTAYVAHTNLATALFELDDFANAAREFVWILNQQKDLQKDRQRAAVTLYFLGICFDKLGDLEQAQKVYKQFLTVAGPENQLEIDKVKLRLPSLQRQLEKGQGKRKK